MRKNAAIMNQNFHQWSTSPKSTWGSASKQPKPLRSCLRQRSSLGGKFPELRGGSISSDLIHSQPPLGSSLQNQYQARQDVDFSPRSAVSEPIISRSTVAFAETPANWSTSSVPSAPLLGDARRGGCSSSNNCIRNATEDNERQFMRVTKLLVTRHNMSGSTDNNPSSAIQILHHEFPTFEQRMIYHNNLKRNVAFLPMFPEPDEHPSLAMTRYAEKVFGPILAREVKSFVGNNVAGARGSQSMKYDTNYDVSQSPLPLSPHHRISSPSSQAPNTFTDETFSGINQFAVSTQFASNSATVTYGTSQSKPTPIHIATHEPKTNNLRDPPTTQLIQPLSISTSSADDKNRPATMSNRSLIGASTDSTGSDENMEGQSFDNSSLPSSSTSIQGYQTLTIKEMLPPITPRERILYYPSQSNSTTPCCIGLSERTRRNNSTLRKRPPSYHQLYIKCERSEPFINKDSDIVTWYRNASDNRVTADRTLVVRGTTDLRELIIGIAESFGLTSLHKDINNCRSDDGEDDNLSLGCYKDVCFLSDIKMTTCVETSETHLTPLPIPGFYYKYVDRSDDTSSNKSRRGHVKSSSVLSSEMLGLRRTLVAQLLDNPIYPRSRSPINQIDGDNRKGVRTRLALVYCTPKRNAYISPRSTYHGVLPETIYHFQIMLEGIVAEDDLPSSFQSQTAIRCVGGTGGVLGGSLIDTQDEVDELNRTLWNGRDVIGLLSPRANQHEKLERIIDMLRIPLFDTAGNQAPKEFVVDRCLYKICSGKLSMEIATTTKHTVEALEETAEWLAQRVNDISKSLANSAIACEDTYDAFENDYNNVDDFDSAVSRLSRRKKKKWQFA